jgi:hypothetical protein
VRVRCGAAGGVRLVDEDSDRVERPAGHADGGGEAEDDEHGDDTRADDVDEHRWHDAVDDDASGAGAGVHAARNEG